MEPDAMGVSIICPLYNKERFVNQTITSVQAQTESNWELIIVDDGSTDNSFSYAAAYAQKDPRVRLVKREAFTETKGASVCRNIGIRESRFGLILFLDADDMLAPHCLSRRLEVIKSAPYGDFYIFTTKGFVDESTIPVSAPQRREAFQQITSRDKWFKKFCRYSLPWNISAPVFRKACLLRAGGFTESFQRLQDPELHIRILADENTKGVKVLNILPDVFIRLAEDRRHTDKLQHLKNHLSAITYFLHFFSAYLNPKELSMLRGYILSAEQHSLFTYHELEGKGDEIKKAMTEFYKEDPVKRLIDTRFLRFIKLVRSLGNISVLRKLKVHSGLIEIYKLTLN